MDAMRASEILRARQDVIVRQLPAERFAEWELIEAVVRHLKRLIHEGGPRVKVRVPARLRRLLTAPKREGS